MKFSVFENDDAGLGNMSSDSWGTVYNPFGENYTGWTSPEYGGGGGGGGFTIGPDPFDLDNPGVIQHAPQQPACSCLAGTAYLDENNNCRCTQPTQPTVQTSAPTNGPTPDNAAAFEIDDRTLLIGGAIVAAVLLFR
jgi:hypothetical protein